MKTNDYFFDVEFKLLPSEDKTIGAFEGYGSVYGRMDDGMDIVSHGAFDESLKKMKPVMLLQHNPQNVVGVWTSATSDEKGLFVRGSLNLEVQAAREAYALLKQNAFGGLSIGYRVKDASFDNKTGVRTIKKAELLEISLVTFPMNREALVTAVKQAPKTERELEKVLRENCGLGRTQAKALISRGWRGLVDLQRDVEDSENSSLTVQRDADEITKNLKSILNTIKGDKHDHGTGRN